MRRSVHEDDEEQPPAKKRTSAKRKKRVQDGDDEEDVEINIRRPKLNLKIGPKHLVEAIESMSPKQLAALEEMGFGQLVHLKITSIPAEMAYALLENFNQDNCSRIRLLDDEPLHISVEDVYATLGLPRGEQIIKTYRKHKQNEFMDRLVDVVAKVSKDGKEKNFENLTPKDVKEQLNADLDGGEWFKKVFLILLDSVLIAPAGNGHCQAKILNYIADVSKVRQYNWCQYVLDVLVKAHDNWKNSEKKSSFTGSITFLLACYVDRVVYRTRMVIRRFPTVRNWKAPLIRKRGQMEFKDGGFIGRGSKEDIVDPVSIEALYVNKDAILFTPPSTANDPQTIDTPPPTSTANDPPAADATAKAPPSNEEVKNSITEAAIAISKMVKNIKEAQPSATDVNCFKVAAINALKMIGVEVEEGENDVSNPITHMTQAMEDDQDSDQEWINVVVNIMEAFEETHKLVDEGTSVLPGIKFGKKM